MDHLAVLLDPQTAMRLTEVVEPHREPTHPAVIPLRFGKGQRLAHLPLVPQATGSVMPFDDTRIDLLIAQ